VTNPASFRRPEDTVDAAAAAASDAESSTLPSSEPSQPVAQSAKKGKKRKNRAVVAVDKDKTVFVSGLPHHVGMKSVRKYFKQCGAIAYVTLPKFEDTGKSRGIAQITFTRRKSAERALALSGEYWGKRYLEITPHDGGSQWQPTTEKPQGCKTIFVGNLDYDVTDEQIREAFAKCGEIQSVRWGTEKESGDFRGFGHISFYEEAACDRAAKLAGAIFRGRPLKIDFAEERYDETWAHKSNGWGENGSAAVEAPAPKRRKKMSKALENRLRKEAEAEARKRAAASDGQ
jgi:nucleolin